MQVILSKLRFFKIKITVATNSSSMENRIFCHFCLWKVAQQFDKKIILKSLRLMIHWSGRPPPEQSFLAGSSCLVLSGGPASQLTVPTGKSGPASRLFTFIMR